MNAPLKTPLKGISSPSGERYDEKGNLTQVEHKNAVASLKTTKYGQIRLKGEFQNRIVSYREMEQIQQAMMKPSETRPKYLKLVSQGLTVETNNITMFEVVEEKATIYADLVKLKTETLALNLELKITNEKLCHKLRQPYYLATCHYRYQVSPETGKQVRVYAMADIRDIKELLLLTPDPNPLYGYRIAKIIRYGEEIDFNGWNRTE